MQWAIKKSRVPPLTQICQGGTISSGKYSVNIWKMYFGYLRNDNQPLSPQFDFDICYFRNN